MIALLDIVKCFDFALNIIISDVSLADLYPAQFPESVFICHLDVLTGYTIFQ